MGNKNKNLVIPNSEKLFLKDFLESLRKRTKALKHKSSKIDCEKTIVEVDDVMLEKIELCVHKHTSGKSFPLTFQVWEDRWISMSFCEWKNGGRCWRWSEEGKLLPANDGKSIISLIEKSISLSSFMSAEKTSMFSQLWRPAIARSPELLITNPNKK